MKFTGCALLLGAAAAALSCLVVVVCAQERRTGNTCTLDNQCPENALCKNRTYCVCRDTYVIHPYNTTHRQCLIEAQTIGDPCTVDIQCKSKLGIHARCSNENCVCENDSHFEDGRCFQTALIGQKCIVDQNCHLGDSSVPERQSFCVRGVCNCQLLFSPRDDGTRCVRDANLNEKCEDQFQCANVGQECVGGLCRCKTNWITHPIENRCVKVVASLGDECETDVQCDRLSGGSLGAAICYSGHCSCTFNARRVGDLCWVAKLPGQDCTHNEECVSEEGKDGYCQGGRCTCETCVPDHRDFASAAPKPLLSFAVIVLVSMCVLL